jgi:DNA-binding NarL/FixJ family response regulator
MLDSVLKPSTGSEASLCSALTSPTGSLAARRRGRGTKEIATILCVSVKTVEFHKSRSMQQLDIHTTADLTKYAITHGITGL